jgi:nucleoside-diphosphate-sugar epimerase
VTGSSDEIQLGRVLFTGGSGFVGRAVLPIIGQVASEITVIGRQTTPDLSLPKVSYHQHDLIQPLDLESEFDVIVHAASPASAVLNAQDPAAMLRVIIEGMHNLLEFVRRQPAPPRLLFMSSGAVYGDMPEDCEKFYESCLSAPSPLSAKSAYAEGKRVAELLLSIASAEGWCTGVIARLFAFSGPNLPRDRHFAVGNFVRDAVEDQMIIVRGDGSPVRSYMDESDLAEWILAILLRGKTGFPYHVGSERNVTIFELAQIVKLRYELLTGNSCQVRLLGETSVLDGVSRYVPDTTETRRSLQVQETVSLERSIDTMIKDALVKRELEY